MKVLMINVVCGIRSTGRICADLAQALESQGHEVKIAYGRERVPEQYQKYAVRIGNDLDVSIAGAEARLFDNEGLSCKKATKQFLQWADNYNPNLLWLHNIHGYYINYELLFSWIKSRPQMKVQWTLHDCWAFTGHCAYFSMAKCDQWKTCCKKCPQLREYPACYGLGHVKKNYNKKKSTFTGVKDLTLITPSRWLANLTRESFFKEYPVEIHYNKIDTNIFRPTPSDFRKKYGLENKIIILGVASVWDKRKGLDDFCKLAQMLDDKYAIVLVGLNSNQKKKIPRNILAINKINNPRKLAELYTVADLFINTTYEDNYPTVNLEAEACGTSVITYDSGGSRETITSNKSNFVKTGDLQSIVNIILEHSRNK